MIPYFSPISFFDAFPFAFSDYLHKWQVLFPCPAFLPVMDAGVYIPLPFRSLPLPCISRNHSFFRPAPGTLLPAKNDAIFFADFCYSRFDRKWYLFLRLNVFPFRKYTVSYFLMPHFSPLYRPAFPASSLWAQALVAAFPNDPLCFAVFTLWSP